VSFFVF